LVAMSQSQSSRSSLSSIALSGCFRPVWRFSMVTGDANSMRCCTAGSTFRADLSSALRAANILASGVACFGLGLSVCVCVDARPDDSRSIFNMESTFNLLSVCCCCGCDLQTTPPLRGCFLQLDTEALLTCDTPAAAQATKRVQRAPLQVRTTTSQPMRRQPGDHATLTFVDLLRVQRHIHTHTRKGQPDRIQRPEGKRHSPRHWRANAVSRVCNWPDRSLTLSLLFNHRLIRECAIGYAGPPGLAFLTMFMYWRAWRFLTTRAALMSAPSTCFSCVVSKLDGRPSNFIISSSGKSFGSSITAALAALLAAAAAVAAAAAAAAAALLLSLAFALLGSSKCVSL
jgi:hypothetical protein